MASRKRPEVDPLISDYSHLKDKPREADALKTLQKIASLVKPVMRRRGWRVGTLAEFYPEERNLLGKLHGNSFAPCLHNTVFLLTLSTRCELEQGPEDMPATAISWRCQAVSSHGAGRGHDVARVRRNLCHYMDFLTALRLSHNVYGAHDAKFHALWQQLRDEHEQLTRKGYTGEGFLSEGRKLGGKRIPMDEARRRARAAAEKRRVLNAGSGQRLGGMPVLRGSDMRRVIADAAQRRLTVTKGCGSESENSKAMVDQATRNGFRTQAEEDDANERAIMQAYIELVQEEEREKRGDSYVPPSEENPTGGASDSTRDTSGSPSAAPAIPFATKPVVASRGEADPSPQAASTSSSSRVTSAKESTPAQTPSTWPCFACTYENPMDYLCCDVCGTERPAATSETMAKSQIAPTQTAEKRHSAQLGAGQPTATPSETLGWICHVCGAFMENQWWTCSSCGTMKLSS